MGGPEVMNPKDPTLPRVGRRHLALVGPMLVLALAACEESPTGRKQVALVPYAQMAEIGARNFEELLRTNSLSQDRRV